MQFKLKHTRLRLDWLTLLFPCIAILLGEGKTVLLLALSLLAHEAAHFAMAKALRVGMSSVRLTPFGGLAQIDNPYAVSPPRLFAVAAAGPAANLLLILSAAALCRWLPIDPELCALFLSINAMLMVFNLLPALPLDGGRMLYCVLAEILSPQSALRIGLIIGRALAVLLALIALWGWLVRHVLNLSPLFAAIFILASASDERGALSDSHIQALLNSIRPITEPVAAQIIAIDAAMPPETALRAARPDRATLFAVYENGQLARFTDDRALLARLAQTDVPEQN